LIEIHLQEMFLITISWTTTFAFCLWIMFPLFLFERYAYLLFCKGNFEPRPWCSNRIPLLYQFVQEYYWNVGFLRYYQIKQIPSFLLACPMIIISFFGIVTYLRQDGYRILRIGLITSKNQLQSSPYYSDNLFVYISHWMFLTLFGLLVMHVQVITRFICSQTPAFYWFTSSLLASQQTPFIIKNSIKAYYYIFFIIGPILFCTFYPWT